jgi:hypothetical protein
MVLHFGSNAQYNANIANFVYFTMGGRRRSAAAISTSGENVHENVQENVQKPL